MRRGVGLLCGTCLVASIASPAPLWADETVVYAYDFLGRLIQVNISGGPNSGVATQTCFDRAGNRSSYSTGSTSPGVCPSPAPTPTPVPTQTPTPTPTAQPPVTTADSLTVGVCDSASVNVISNDSDPGGHYPLTVVAVTGGQKGQPSVDSSSSVSYSANGTTGSDQITYTVQNTAGASATGTIAITVVNHGGCN